MKDGQWALVTGASRGLGFAIAERLAADGIPVIGIARKAPDKAFPGTFVEADLSDAATMQAALDDIVSRHAVTRLVNNVGHVVPERIGSIDLDQMARIFDFNLRTTVQATQAALPAMRAAAFGRIVNISSMTVLGYPERTSYAASKAALGSFTRTWALELAKSGITVNAVAPGPTETELFRVNSPVGSESEARYLSTIPMDRLGQPAEIAAAVSYLMSVGAGYTTGQTLFVDGGGSIGLAGI
ncbi:MAG TPA: SDR family oxidoreductase [Sphingobium sp.]